MRGEEGKKQYMQNKEKLYCLTDVFLTCSFRHKTLQTTFYDLNNLTVVD